jgi:tRNA (cmo5U34)-methyltransferase
MSDAVRAFSAHASDYDRERRRIVPCFEQFYGTAVTLVSLRPGPVERVLDLGTGTGLLGAAVLARHPDAQLLALDGSAQMLERASERLPASTRTVLADLRDPLPDGPFDAVVSSLAIHHLEHDAQRDLYGRVAQALRPGGVFVNAEHVAGPTAWLERAYRQLWRDAAAAAGASREELEAADERMLLNRCVPVAELLRWMDAAGLQDGDCFFKQLHFAVVAGWRSAAQLD